MRRRFETYLTLTVAPLLGCALICCVLVCPPAVARSDRPDAVQANRSAESSTPVAAPADSASQTAGQAAPAPAAEDDVQRHFIDGRAAEGTGQTSRSGTSKGSGGPNVLSLLWPLAVILALIVLVYWAARRYLPGMKRLAGSDAVKVLARTYVSPRQSIALVKAGRRVLVVGQTAERLSALASIDDPEEVSELLGLCQGAGEGSAGASFRKAFQEMDDEFRAAEDAAAPADGEELRRVREELDRLAEKVRRVANLPKK
jgi:flagellar biogenesis protein FliO